MTDTRYDPTLTNGNPYNADLAREAYEREVAVDPQAWRNWEFHHFELDKWTKMPKAGPFWASMLINRRSPSAPPVNPASGKVIEREGEDPHPRMCRCLACMTKPAPPSDKVIAWVEKRHQIVFVCVSCAASLAQSSVETLAPATLS